MLNRKGVASSGSYLIYCKWFKKNRKKKTNVLFLVPGFSGRGQTEKNDIFLIKIRRI